MRWLALLFILGCEAPPLADRPPPIPTAETVHADDGPMTLSMRTIDAEGWSGRLVVVTFARGSAVRVIPSDGPRPLDAIVGPAGAPQPFAAIDGGFYDLEGDPLGLVRTGARDVSALRPGGGSGVLVVERGVPRVVHRDAYRSSSAITEAVQSIDRIVRDGASLVGPRASQRRAARSAFAIGAAGELHLVVAFDARAIAEEEVARIVLDEDSGTTGPTLGEMAELLIALGARDALGLDGGFSTSLTVKSAERALRVEAYRATINAVLIHAP